VPVIELQDSVVLLGRFPALTGVNLRIESGETVLLQGPNGAGKSTLLHLCAGLVAPVSGSSKVFGFDLSATKERQEARRRIAMLGHDTGLYIDLTVIENLHFWARAAGLDSELSKERVDGATKRLGIDEGLFDLAVRLLSAGQRRRVSLAALIVRRPELWLLDEPHAGLDQAGRDLVDDLITDAVIAGGTVVVASHDLDRVGLLSGRIVTLAGGLVRRDEVI